MFSKGNSLKFGLSAKDAKVLYIRKLFVRIETAPFFIKEESLLKIWSANKKLLTDFK